MRFTTRRTVMIAGGAALGLVMAAGPAAAGSGSTTSATGNAWGHFKDDGDIVTVCDQQPNNGHGAYIRIAVQQADGSYLSKDAVQAWNGTCTSVHQDIARENAVVQLTVCDIIPSRGGTAYCQQRWLY